MWIYIANKCTKFYEKDSAQAKISLKVVGGLLFLTHPVDVLIIEGKDQQK